MPLGHLTFLILTSASVWVLRLSALIVALALVWFLASAFGLMGSGVFNSQLSDLFAFLSWPGLPESIGLSLWTGMASAILALLITRFALSAWLAPTRAGNITRFIVRLCQPILAVPHVAFAIGLTLLIWPGGWIARLLSPWLTGWDRVPDWVVIGDPLGLSLIAGLMLRELPFLLFSALAALSTLNGTDITNQGRSLGLSTTECWHRLVWPKLWPSLRLPMILVLAYGLTNVDMALVLAPNTPPPLAVQLMVLFGDSAPAKFAQVPWGAVVLTLVAIVGIAATMLPIELFGHKIGLQGPWNRSTRALSRAFLGISGILIGITVFVFIAGFVANLLFAFSRRWRFPDAFPDLSLRTFSQLQAELIQASTTTLVLASVVTAISFILLILALERLSDRGNRTLPGAWVWSLYTPMIVPQILVVFALYGAGITLGGPPGLVMTALGHALFCFCFAGLLLGPTWLRFDADLIAQSRALGMSAWARLWRIKLPQLAQPIVLAFALTMTVSFALYLPTVVLSGGRVDTLLTEGVHFAANVRRPQMALYALVQTTLSLAVLGLFTWFGRKARQ